VVEADEDRLHISLRRTPLDVKRMLALAYASGMPSPAIEWWVGLWGRT
jgi:hypothetical protein